MYKIALERAGTCHIAHTMELSEPRPCVYVFEKDICGYTPPSTASIPNWFMQEVRFEVTDREWQGHRVFKEVV
jgi:hypothetical protein